MGSSVIKEKNTSEDIILVVDDEAMVLESLAEYLRGVGYTVLSANTEKQALALAGEHPIAAIVTDMVIGSGSGLNLLHQIKTSDFQKNLDMVSVVMTGYATLGSALEAIRLGVDSFLLKPINLQELFQTLEQGIKERHKKQKIYKTLALELSKVDKKINIFKHENTSSREKVCLKEIQEFEKVLKEIKFLIA